MNFKIRLVSVASMNNAIGIDPEQVIFENTPVLTESGPVEYNQVTPIHMPGSIQVYRSTNSRTFTINATMYSRTIAEASQNMKYVQTLRSWRYPYFGNSSTLSAEQQNNRLNSSSQTQQSDTRLGQNMDRPLTPEERASMARDRIASQGMELLGAPPDVLYLYGYSNMINDGSDTYGGVRPNGNVNLNRIPVVMSDLNITYPDDVDYLPTYSDMTGNVVDSASEPFPIKLTVSVTLLETHSPREYEKFDLRKYKQGILVNF